MFLFTSQYGNIASIQDHVDDHEETQHIKKPIV